MPAAARERLAERLARALADPGFRAELRQSLDRSRMPEHKLHLERYLGADDRRALRALARLNRVAITTLDAEAAAVPALEMYLPVPAHRAAWQGDDHILVATAAADHEAPVAFTPRGERLVLDPERPPATPVLALVPVESDFDHAPAQGAPSRFLGDGGGGSTPPPPPPKGLYLTRAHYTSDYEGWLKGAPEFEIHVLGQAGSSDSLQSYSCTGERAGGYYYYNQDNLDWSGSALLMTDTQIASYKSAHPNQNFRVFVVEDDDTACQIKVDSGRFTNLVKAVETAYPQLTGGRDSTSSTLTRLWKRANALQKVLRAIASVLNSNDEMVGNAVEASVTGAVYPNANWVVKGDGNATNGWIYLEMR
jgi:hypothetical protein